MRRARHFSRKAGRFIAELGSPTFALLQRALVIVISRVCLFSFGSGEDSTDTSGAPERFKWHAPRGYGKATEDVAFQEMAQSRRDAAADRTRAHHRRPPATTIQARDGGSATVSANPPKFGTSAEVIWLHKGRTQRKRKLRQRFRTAPRQQSARPRQRPVTGAQPSMSAAASQSSQLGGKRHDVAGRDNPTVVTNAPASKEQAAATQTRSGDGKAASRPRQMASAAAFVCRHSAATATGLWSATTLR